MTYFKHCHVRLYWMEPPSSKLNKGYDLKKLPTVKDPHDPKKATGNCGNP